MKFKFDGFREDKKIENENFSFVVCTFNHEDVLKVCPNYYYLIKYLESIEKLNDIYEVYIWCIDHHGTPVEKIYVFFDESIAAIEEFDETVSMDVPFKLSETYYC